MSFEQFCEYKAYYLSFVPLIVYSNPGTDKLKILKDNQGKAGVYQWVSKINGKTYIGSSVDLYNRLRCYFNPDWLELETTRSKSMIYRSLLKNRYSNFSLNILEYCTPLKAIEREQYYLDLLNPEYNILKKAGSLLGFKHSEETIAKMKAGSLNRTAEHKAKLLEHLYNLSKNPELQLKRLENLKVYLTSKENVEHLKRLNADPELRAKRLEHLKRLHSSAEHKEHLNRLHENVATRFKGRPKPEGSGRPNVSIEVLDSLNNEIKVYPSLKEAAEAIGVNPSSISKAFKRLPEGESTIFLKKKRYHITRLV
uniref:GIY-YIG endonuclease n=1 Tax=Juglanconis juglandina TaxID=1940567 RepID=A0A291LJ02_9PEZI|nr:GIY-YIG endonuclease [Juglanconis juglandina]